MDFSSDSVRDYQERVSYAIFLVGLFFIILFVRVAYLQVIKGDYFRSFSTDYTIKEIKFPAPRGLIYDRYGAVLTENRPSFDIVITPQYVQDPEKMLNGLQELAGIRRKDSDALWKKTKESPAFTPHFFKKDVSLETVSKIRAYRSSELLKDDRYDLYGVEVLARPIRHYPWKDLAGMTFGHVGEISSAELKKFKQTPGTSYALGDVIGSSGLEKIWERRLRGLDGFEQKIIDATGQEISSDDMASLVVHRKPKGGDHLITTLDLDLQKYAKSRFGSRIGTVVAMDPRNGEILTFLSSPSYDPNVLAGGLSSQAWKNLVDHPDKPFLNRAYQSAYPPGSVYKIVTAIAALEEGVIHLDEKIDCPGYLEFGRRFRCWKPEGHGTMDLREAIVQSCDVFFYHLGIRLGVDKLEKYAKILGLGAKTNIELEGENSGLIPTKEWKKKNRNKDWIESETLSLAIGQGYNLVTPLQNAKLISEIANGGRSIRPHLKYYFKKSGSEVVELEDEKLELLPIKKEHIKFIQEALQGVVADRKGTAHALSWRKVSIAGKTGTAQVLRQEDLKAEREYKSRDHAWFVAYAPVKDPELAVSILVEHGGHGSSGAAPIAGDIIEKYFKLKERSK